MGRSSTVAGRSRSVAGKSSPGTRLRPLTAWQQAVAAHELFETGSAEKTGPAFEKILDEFRAIYHDNPRDAHAADAVDVVAQLLGERGRAFTDEKDLRAAIGQYEFLRKQYPTSGLRLTALFAEAHIEADDLDDAVAARRSYRKIEKGAPRSAAAEHAREALAELEKQDSITTSERLRARSVRERVQGSDEINLAHRNISEIARAESAHGEVRSDGVENPERRKEPAVSSARNPAGATGESPMPSTTAGHAAGSSPRAREVAVVSGIRHWSTPTYTRVAIDLGGEVTFQAARVPHPDRIFFDLHGARLGPELVGKSFDVTDDGFLKKIRAGQAAGDVTRVVLDVNDVTDYTAFLLPNPYRLIIDIHGARVDSARALPRRQDEVEVPAEVPVNSEAGRQASAAANASGLPATAPTDGGEAARPVQPSASEEQRSVSRQGKQANENGAPAPSRNSARTSSPGQKVGVVAKSTTARPVPNTVAVKSPATTSEVAAVSDLPGKVQATTEPSNKPIVATVARNRELPLPPRSRRGQGKTSSAAAIADAAPARAAEKTADGQTSMIRALGLKIGRIVIDAGHGGHDSGTLGVDGIAEKDVVLDVALRLGKLLHERLGAEIIYTRSDDTFIPLETRTAIANKAQADLFLSVHANSSSDASARGVETYYLNFTSSPDALETAARENAVSGQSIHQLSDLVKKITLKDKISESREFASDVESSLYAGLAKGNDGLKNRGVKKAPFVVLIGANMPSILAEISFVTNPRDAGQLRRPEYRERVAESLFAGVAKYEDGLAGMRQEHPETRASSR